MSMRRLCLFVFVILLATVISAWAQPKPSLSGTWTLDTAKSDPQPRGPGGPEGPPGGGMPAPQVTIGQTATDITIDGVTYITDGVNHTVQLPTFDGTTQAAATTAKWDGAKLVIEVTQYSGMGLSTTTEIRTLSADGKEMTVETSSPMGGGRMRKTVYRKN